MTDEPDSVDELISRYLDAEATEAEIARVEGDPALLARAESMRAAIEAVAAPVTVPTPDLDRIRAVALAESTGTTPQVTDLAAAGAERRRRLERRNRAMAVAAAFVFLAAGVVAAQSITSGDDDDSDAATETSDGSGDTADESDDAASDDSGGDLGTFATGAADAEMAEADMDAAADDGDEMAEEEEAPVEEPAGDDAAGDDADDAVQSDSAEEEAPVAEDAPRLGRELLPDELPPVESVDDLVEVILATYAAPVDAEADGGQPVDEVLAGVCDEVLALFAETLPTAVSSVETLTVEIAGIPSTVLVGSNPAGDVSILAHPIDDCTAAAPIG